MYSLYVLRCRLLLSLCSGGTNYKRSYVLVILMFTNFSKDYYHVSCGDVAAFKTPGNKMKGNLFCYSPFMVSWSKWTFWASSEEKTQPNTFLSFGLVKFKFFWRNISIISSVADQICCYCCLLFLPRTWCDSLSHLSQFGQFSQRGVSHLLAIYCVQSLKCRIEI